MRIKSVLGRVLRKATDRGFRPYLVTHNIGGLELRFLCATPQAAQWYDPVSKLGMAEYDWILENIDFAGQNIIDGGSHHGHYSSLMGLAAKGGKVVSVDPIDMNLSLIEVNLRLNQLEPHIVEGVIANSEGMVGFEDVSNGQMASVGGIQKPAKRLATIMPEATIVKLDLEGAEFSVLPAQIDEMPSVHTWIVEIHCNHGDPKALTGLLADKGFRIHWVNTESGRVEEHRPDTQWNCHHTSIFAQR